MKLEKCGNLHGCSRALDSGLGRIRFSTGSQLRNRLPYDALDNLLCAVQRQRYVTIYHLAAAPQPGVPSFSTTRWPDHNRHEPRVWNRRYLYDANSNLVKKTLPNRTRQIRRPEPTPIC